MSLFEDMIDKGLSYDTIQNKKKRKKEESLFTAMIDEGKSYQEITNNKQEKNLEQGSNNQGGLLLPLLNQGKTINIDENKALESLSNMSYGKRVSTINATTKNKNDANKLNLEALKYQQEKQTKEKANQINNDMANGNYTSAISHIISGVPQKALDSTSTTFVAMNSIIAPKRISNTQADENELLKTNKLLSKKYEQTTENIDNNIVKTSSQVSGTIGGMVPSIISNIVLPGSGVVTQGVNVGAQEYQDTLNDDASNKLKAGITGTAKGIASGLIEKISGGNILGKGSLDDAATKFISKQFKGKVGQKIASKAYEMIGEIGEENLENQVGYVIDKIINNKDLPDFQNWWNEAKETSKNTFLTTLVLNVLGLGGNTYNDVKNLESKKYIDEAKKVIRTELNNSNIDIDTKINKLNDINDIKNMEDYKNIVPTIKQAQNQTSEQINNIPIDKYNISAKKYSIYTENETVKSIKRVTEQRGINTTYNAEMFKDSKTNAIWRTTTDSNGNVIREVILNPKADTNKTLQNVIVHELTHDFEGTKEYTQLADTIMKNVVTKTDYETARKSLEETYSNVYDKNSVEFKNLVDQEAVADVLGNKLGNQEFVNTLTMEKPSVAKKIYNWVIDKLNKITGYSNEKIFWADVKNKFENAYRQDYQGNNNKSRYSIQTDNNGNKYVKVDTDQNIFKGKSIKEQTKIAQEYILNNFREKGLLKNDNIINVSRKTANEYTHPKNGLDNATYSSKMKASTELDNLLEISKFIKSESDDGRHIFAKNGWDYYETVFKVGDKTYSGLLNIANGENGKLLYDITNIKERASNYSVKTISVANSNINNSISSKNNDVNTTTKYSMQESENNTQLSERAEKELHRYVHMDKEQLNKAFSDAVENKENMLEEYNTLSKEYKEFQKTEEFMNALKNEDYDSEVWNKAGKYADKLRYYNENYEKYKAQQEAINSLLMDKNTETRSSNQIVEEAEKHFGTTRNFKETAYIDINGKQIDFSGKHEGGMSGRRSLDHRQINEIDTDMQSFIDMGNIRVMPEGNGINLSVEPNEKQYNTLSKYIDSVNGELYIDINKTNTRYDSATYKAGTSTGKILNDIRYYFKNGEFPKQSEFAQFRYSIIKDNAWQKFLNKNYKNEGTGQTIKDVKLPIKVEEKSQKINFPTAEDIERMENKKQSENSKIPGREDINLPKTKQELLENNSKALNKYIQERNSTIRKIEAQINQKQQELNSKENKDSIIANKLKTQIIELNKRKKDIELMYNKKIDDTFNKGEKIIQSQDMSGRKAIIEKNRELAREKISNISTWKDKNNGFKYQRETMERNMFDIIPNKQEAQDIVDTYFEPIHKSEAEKQKFINKYNYKIKKLNLNKYESEAVQLLGEQKYNPDFKADDVKEILDRVNENIENGKMDKAKVDKAIEVFRSIYDELFELENKALKENGYPEKPYRKGYFPHFIDFEPITKTEEILDKLGFKIDKRPLPTDIAGTTEQFVPGKTWNRSSLNRKTDKTTYNALKGFDTYISQAADNIFHTENIQKLRALENEIRYQYSDKGIQERIDEIYNNNILNQEEQQAAIEKIFEQVDNPMPNLVVELRRYTNALANKKSEADRSAEQKYGRQLYSTVNAIESRFGANAVGLNIGSAITNFIPITQAYSQVSTKNMGRATLDTIKSYIQDDGFVDKSTFLTNRINKSEKLYKTSLEKISDKTSFLFNAIDDVTSNIIVRGKYLENINNGMSEVEAIKNADRFAANVMADRSKGALPTLFEEKSPITKMFTQFQLEVNNQYSYMFKDIPRDLKEKGLANIALAFFKMFVAAFLYNKASEEIVGRKAAFSPIDIAIDSYNTLSDENTSTADKMINVGKDVAEEFPFVGGFLGGGRIPVSGALPDAENTFKAATGLVTGEMDSNKAMNTLGKEVSKPLYYLLPPFGGAQAKKTIEGIGTVANGGSYGIDSKGEETLQFPVENANAGDYLKAGLFGKYALDNAKEYANRGYKSLNAKQTKSYEESKIPYKEYLEYLSKDLKKKEDKINYLSEQNWNENQKWGIYKNEILSSTERENDGGSQLKDAEYIISKGMSKTDFINLYNKAQLNNIDIPTQKDYKKMERTGVSLEKYIDYKVKVKEKTEEKRKSKELTDTQDLKDKDKIQILLDSNYSNKEISSIYENYIKNTKDTQYYIIEESGIDIKEYLKYKQQNFESDRKEDGTINGKAISKSKQKKEYEYVNNMKITYNQKLILLGMQYSLTSGEKTKLANYVNDMKLNKKEKLEVYGKLKGFKVYKNGRVTW